MNLVYAPGGVRTHDNSLKRRMHYHCATGAHTRWFYSHIFPSRILLWDLPNGIVNVTVGVLWLVQCYAVMIWSNHTTGHVSASSRTFAREALEWVLSFNLWRYPVLGILFCNLTSCLVRFCSLYCTSNQPIVEIFVRHHSYRQYVFPRHQYYKWISKTIIKHRWGLNPQPFS